MTRRLGVHLLLLLDQTEKEPGFGGAGSDLKDVGVSSLSAREITALNVALGGCQGIPDGLDRNPMWRYFNHEGRIRECHRPSFASLSLPTSGNLTRRESWPLGR